MWCKGIRKGVRKVSDNEKQPYRVRTAHLPQRLAICRRKAFAPSGLTSRCTGPAPDGGALILDLIARGPVSLVVVADASRPRQRGGGYDPLLAWRFAPHNHADQADSGRKSLRLSRPSRLIRRPVRPNPKKIMEPCEALRVK